MLETTADMDNKNYTVFTDLILYINDDWQDENENLIIGGVFSHQECYKICFITNHGECFLFRYNFINMFNIILLVDRRNQHI